MRQILMQEPLLLHPRGWLVLAGTAPLRRAAEPVDHRRQQAGGMGGPVRRRVLLVDDEPEVLELTRELLLQSFPDLTVDTAPTGPDALRLLDTTTYDAVVSDYRMPDMDGLEFFVAASGRVPEERRILMTAYADKALRDRARRAGLVFFEKAGDPRNIVDAISQALKGI